MRTLEKSLRRWGAEHNANGPNPPDMTDIKKQATASCRYPSDQDIEDCYIESLKSYRGHPQDLMKGDIRDAVAYCSQSLSLTTAVFVADASTIDFAPYSNEEVQQADRSRRPRTAAPRG